MKKEEILNLVKATRIDRTLFGLSALLIPIAYNPIYKLDLILFCICCVLLYSFFGIHNAKQDKDHNLPGYTNLVLIFFVILSFLIALFNKSILTAVILYLFLGFFYNTVSRKILLLDSTILSMTHYLLPILFCCYFLDIEFMFSMKIAIYFFIVSLFYMPLKNIRGSAEDKKRGYKSLTTLYPNGAQITFFLMDISFVLMTISYFIFDLEIIYLFCLLIIYLFERIMKYLEFKGEKILLAKIFRAVDIFFCSAFVLSKTTNFVVGVLSFLFSFTTFYFVARYMRIKGYITISYLLSSIKEFLMWEIDYFNTALLFFLSNKQMAKKWHNGKI
ncbi:hypothetical protein JXB41_03785 [Candidatus Woesearchaeota archaeon]|nr:hypothetical protein [Candidatus Woesearchaeota archaeon]